jgi:Subtilase family/Secretion system C-terminal sorting domain
MIKILYKSHRFALLIVLACLLVAHHTFAQEEKAQHVIRLNSGPVPAPANASIWLDSMSALPIDKEPTQVMIHFTKLPTEAERAALKQNGITIFEYIPDNTFSAVVKFPLNKEQVLAAPVYSIVAPKPEWKAGAYLWKTVNAQKGTVEVLVSFLPGIDNAEIKQFIASIGGAIKPGHMEQYGAYKVIVAAAKVRSMAQWYGVRYISPISEIVPLDLQSRPAVKGNIAVSSPVYGGYGLTGDSVTVGVGDNASGIYHSDLKDRITNFNPAPESHHGEHVNGIVGSATIVDPLAASMAPHVSLVDYLYDLILPATGEIYNDYHVTITNNSYEVVAADCDYAGTYDVYSRFLDTLSVQYPEVQHVFASGNDGWQTCSVYPRGFATVGGGYQPAKNIIVVGSQTDYLIQADDESRGPVKDGRLKPEIVATGLGAYSTISIDGYSWAAGTSMASPQVVGGLAVLTQRYKQVNGTQPRADLMKGILLNGAMDLGNPGPDFSYGFGVMDLYRSLAIIDNSSFFTNNISNGDSQSFTINVPANSGELKVMIVWNDVPASASSAKQLVNDIDLTVKDPASGIHLPLVLDPTPANVNNNATDKPDHLNNVEQVTITNPAAGTYTIKAKGYSIPYGPQHYVVIYDIMPKGVHLTYPIGGEQLSDIDSIRVFWDAVGDGHTFKMEVSQDNGMNWLTIDDHIPADIRHSDFFPNGLNTGNMLVRVSRNGTSESATSQRFTINTQPVVRLDTAQCPGYINIHWTPTLNTSGYYILKKVGFYMKVIDSVTDTTYSFSGMSLKEKSYVAVQPILNGLPGYRSVAAIVIANSGNCSKPVSNGDLMIEQVVAPTSGRMHTSSVLGVSTTMKVKIRDLYTAPCTNYTISYKVNSGAWQTLTPTDTIPANGTAIVSIPGLNLSAPGSYNITVAVQNLAAVDPQHGNDTVSFTVVSLLNDTMNLSTPFFDGFETMGKVSVQHDSIGVSPNSHWDYFNTAGTGRMRSFVNSEVTISGTRSISLDQDRNEKPGTQNNFTGTFNLSNFDTATAEVRVDFDYNLHGTPRSPYGNLVTARGNDTVSWNTLYTYNLNGYPGLATHVQSLSLTDAVRLGHRNFSSSTQVSFGQNDTSLIASSTYGNGITLDNFRMYTVANDASLVSIVSPLPNNCGVSSPSPLTVKVHNGVNYTLHNVHMYYSEDGGTIYSGIIDSIKAKATIDYTFSQQLNMSQGVTHVLRVWLTETGDTYTANDSIHNYHFRNSQIIAAYPYLENFESGDGGYFSDGFKNSWQYGTPASAKINKAASGVKAWKTNLAGHYNNLEYSYLYSPCFDISQLTNPMLSFSAALDIENCGGTLCDAAFVEISFDGESWSRLGSVGEGTNWYDSTFNVWNTVGFTRWHVASVPLPQPGPGVALHLRFVLSADPGVNFEGFALDDIHIFDRAHSILPTDGVTTVTKDLTGNQWIDYMSSDQLLAAVQPKNQDFKFADITLYGHDTLSNPAATQYIFPRSYAITPTLIAGDEMGIRLYLPESDLVTVLNDKSCPSCTPVQDAYSLGVTRYYDNNHINGTLADDIGGVFMYQSHNNVKWVPYDAGYYAEFTSIPRGEYWFNNGGPTGNLSTGTDYLNFAVFRNVSNVTLLWYSLIDTAVNVYTPEWSIDGINFATVTDVAARHEPAAEYATDDPVNFNHYSTFYYRLKWTMTGSDGVYYSPIRIVDSADSSANMITFNAQMIDHRDVAATWHSLVDGTVDHYVLERAINDNAFTILDTILSLRHFGQDYNYIDQHTAAMRSGTLLHYRLTAILDNGTKIVLPVRTVIWVDGSDIVNLYPNPTHDGKITIGWHADPGTTMHIEIFDLALGRSIYEQGVTSTQWNNLTTIEKPRFPSGVYVIRMIIGGNRFTRKIVYE